MTGRLRGKLRKIAITGGIGSGKSTLVRELAALGYPVFDADILVAQVVTQPEIQKHITHLLGPNCYVVDDQGQPIYQRSWVRDRVFADAQARKDLEAIIHPAIFKKFASICDQIHKVAGGVWVFYEAALIFEGSRESDFDAVVSVIADEQVRRRRLAQSRSLSDETVSAIFSAQVSDEVRRRKSNFVVENSDDLSSMTTHALSLIENLRHFFHPQSR